MYKVSRIGVLGAGTMGSQIAAIFANVGVSCLLLDIPSAEGDPSKRAKSALAKLLQQRPSPFFLPEAADRITPGNFQDNLVDLPHCDWVIEAVAEDRSIKRSIWEQAAPHTRADAILSTNTSGIQLSSLTDGFPDSLQKRFLGTHFFNPPRYLHLLEVIPGDRTESAVVQAVSDFGERILGKGIVRCKDTPNFIANRIGSFYSATIQAAMVESDYTIEEVDALTGPLLGMPKSATFRLIDIIGLDVWTQVAQNIYNHTHDAWHSRFSPMPYAETMLKNGWIGEKAGQGFYRRVGADKRIEVLDWKTLQYRPPQESVFESVQHVRRTPDIAARVRTLIQADDKVGRFVWRVFRDVFAYAAAVTPEIADSTSDIDNAIRWGFGHQLGPFELWNALGVRDIARRIEKDGLELPSNISRMLSTGADTFYQGNKYFDLASLSYRAEAIHPAVLRLNAKTRKREVVAENAEASLLDIDDGVLCLEFHSKMNAIGEGALQMIDRGLDLMSGRFTALVIANEGENFSAGANLARLLEWAEAANIAAIEGFIRNFQDALLSLKYAPKPVVAAAFSRALGGGCEVVLQSHRVQALAELYIGLVELNVGLIPAGGGVKELAMRFPDSFHGLDLISAAKVSGSAEEAKQLGFLKTEDRITMNPDFLIGDAKLFALELTSIYKAGTPEKNIPVATKLGYQQFEQEIESRKAAGHITEHDAVVLNKLAYVLTGGGVNSKSNISEQDLLGLEREAFLTLCSMPKTHERIRHILKTGKPLKN